jgi:MFS family permease
LYTFALPVLAVSLTTAPSLVAGVSVMLTLAWPVFGLFAGSIVDRLDRRNVIVMANGARAATFLVLSGAIITDQLSLPILYGAAVLFGVGETLADTALTAIVPAVAADEHLERANARVTAGQTIANSFVGPPLAGAAMAFGAAIVTGAGAALYGIAIAALLLLPGTYRATRATAAAGAASPRNGITDGLRTLWADRVLRNITLFTAAMNVWWAAWAALIVLHVVAPGPVGLDSFGYGLILAASAVGAVAGSLSANWIRLRVGSRNTLAIDVLATAIFVGIPGLTANAWAIGAAAAAGGFGAGVWLVIVGTLRQRRTPDALLGRVYSASRLISWGVLPISAAAAGIAAEFVGIQAVFAVGGAVSLGLLVLFFLAVRSPDIEPVRAPVPEPAAVPLAEAS